MVLSDALEPHGTSTELGEATALRICIPAYPPIVNFMGIVLPAVATLTTGRFLTGAKKPENVRPLSTLIVTLLLAPV
jgi:hypothetical protein